MAVTKKSLISGTPKKATTKSSPKAAASGAVAAAKLKTAATFATTKMVSARSIF